MESKTKEVIDFKLGQFELFNSLLTKNCPPGWVPFYFPCSKGGKDPMGDVSWKHNRILYKNAINFIKLGYNIGISGDGVLVIADADTKEKIPLFKKSLQVKSRSREGGHFYYWWKGEDLPPNIPTDDGEFRAFWQYVISPGSYVHSESKEELSGFYTIENDINVDTLVYTELPLFYREQHDKDLKAIENKTLVKNNVGLTNNGEKSALYNLKMSDLVSVDRARVSHPLHDSETKANFSIAPDGSLGQCLRHNVSLNALQFLAVKSGYMSCQDAGTPHKGAGVSKIDDGAIFHAWCEAKKIGAIIQNDKIPSRAMKFIAIKHNLIDKIDGLIPIDVYNKTIEIIEGEY